MLKTHNNDKHETKEDVENNSWVCFRFQVVAMKGNAGRSTHPLYYYLKPPSPEILANFPTKSVHCMSSLIFVTYKKKCSNKKICWEWVVGSTTTHSVFHMESNHRWTQKSMTNMNLKTMDTNFECTFMENLNVKDKIGQDFSRRPSNVKTHQYVWA